MPADANLRLFVAVELPDAARRAVADAIATLERNAPQRTLRPVRAEGVHLTLKFLGATPESQIPAIIDALQAAASRERPMTLRIGAPDVFGARRNMRVAWLGVEGDTDSLTALAADVDAVLAPLGFAREERPFAAHLTLARVRDEASPADRERIAEAVHRLRRADAAWLASEVALMRSTLAPGGARYDALARLPLQATDAAPQT